MADEGIRMPMGTGGLLRYYDEYKSKVQIKPHYVIIMIVAVIILELLLRGFGK